MKWIGRLRLQEHRAQGLDLARQRGVAFVAGEAAEAKGKPQVIDEGQLMPLVEQFAIGARVRVITGKHIQMDEVHSASSVMSQSDLRLHFGVGKSEVIDAIAVKWPTTQKIERFTQVKPNQILTIREGQGIVPNSKQKPK